MTVGQPFALRYDDGEATTDAREATLLSGARGATPSPRTARPVGVSRPTNRRCTPRSVSVSNRGWDGVSRTDTWEVPAPGASRRGRHTSAAGVSRAPSSAHSAWCRWAEFPTAVLLLRSQTMQRSFSVGDAKRFTTRSAERSLWTMNPGAVGQHGKIGARASVRGTPKRDGGWAVVTGFQAVGSPATRLA